MDKRTILDRLWKTICMLTTLKDKEFDYGEEVAECKIGKNGEPSCGTVCCAMGWYPAFFPKSLIEWEIDEDEDSNEAVGCIKVVQPNKYNLPPSDISTALEIYHGLDYICINFMFYGGNLDLSLTEKGEELLPQIIKMWEGCTFIKENPWRTDCVEISALEGIRSSRTMLIDALRLLHYLIDNNYIKDYRHDN